MDRILKKLKSKPKSDCGSNGEFVSMGLDNMVSVFAILGTAIIIALLTWIIEVTVFKWKDDGARMDTNQYNIIPDRLLVSGSWQT